MCSSDLCKVSGIIKTIPEGSDPVTELKPVVLPTIEAFGWERVMFAGDWPVCTLTAPFGSWANALKTIVAKRSAAFQRKLFHDNAVKFYGLGNAK